MVLIDIEFPIFRKKWITGQVHSTTVVILTESSTGLGTLSSLSELNYNNASDISDPDLLTAIQTINTSNIVYNASIQSFTTNIAPTRDYSDVEDALKDLRTVLTSTTVPYGYGILANYNAYHVTTLTDHASDYTNYSADNWSLWKSNALLQQSYLRRDYERNSNQLSRLATLIPDPTTDPLYQSLSFLNTQLSTTLSSIQNVANAITGVIDNLENGIETTTTHIDVLKNKYSTVYDNLVEVNDRLKKVFTGGDQSLDKV